MSITCPSRASKLMPRLHATSLSITSPCSCHFSVPMLCLCALAMSPCPYHVSTFMPFLFAHAVSMSVLCLHVHTISPCPSHVHCAHLHVHIMSLCHLLIHTMPPLPTLCLHAQAVFPCQVSKFMSFLHPHIISPCPYHLSMPMPCLYPQIHTVPKSCLSQGKAMPLAKWTVEFMHPETCTSTDPFPRRNKLSLQAQMTAHSGNTGPALGCRAQTGAA